MTASEDKRGHTGGITTGHVRTVAQSVGLTGAWVLLGYVVVLITEYVIASIVGAEVFGVVSIGISFVGTFQVVANAGTDRGMIRFVAQAAGKRDAARLHQAERYSWTVTGILSSLLLVAYLVTGHALVAALFSNAPNIRWTLDTLIWVCPFGAFAVLFSSTLAGLERQQYQHIDNTILRPLTRLMLVLLLMVWIATLHAYVFAVCASVVVGTGALFLWRRKMVASAIRAMRSSPGATGLRLIEFLKFSLPLSLIPLFNLSTERFDILLAGHYLSAAETGVYAISRRIGVVLLIPLVVFAGIVGPLASRLQAEGNEEGIATAYAFSTKWVFLLSAFVFVPVVVGAHDLLSLVGPEYVGGAGALRVIAAGSLVNASVGPSGTLLLMMNHPRFVLFNSALAAGIAIATSQWLIPSLGMLGLATAIAAAFVIPNILSIVQIVSALRIRPASLRQVAARIGSLGASLGAAYGVFLLMVRLPLVERIPGVALVGAVVLIACEYVLEGLTPAERHLTSVVIAIVRRRIA